ncbi:carbohydrate-binding module family 50 protein [Exserohilum turcica Et28A]|uniref:Carbohydrate-binding module family 50 protein n=1 Tax=Exserohilum turcicum (strain 28A) TaxID=671987 RepID=R0IZQ5_EXST2|nr:carbohydrate-binding module family 50 protein [Exserohilum turcica Et28A]EOA90021.1 carbohydrate-binding module family 50 protein [Exserohilum turcica Et28A]
MARWSDMDSDAERLPPGFQRIGYDSDTQTYTFRDDKGNTYESDPGNRYGELHLVAEPSPHETYLDAPGQHGPPASNFDDMLHDQERAIKKQNRDALRIMLPFALLVLVFLILVFKLVYRSDDGPPKDDILDCGPDTQQLLIQKGDTCWKFAQASSITVQELLALRGNEALDCHRLAIGKLICVPS